jgi:thymidylate synthase (FAD)
MVSMNMKKNYEVKLLLDHGYIELIESWGSDEAIIEAARMSTQKGFEGWGPKHRVECPNGSNVYDCDCNEPGDEKLLRYLWKNNHATPFEMAGAIVEVQAPIFVFREWHRHRTQSFSEMSSRYTPLPDVNYIPSVERLMMNAGGTNKQVGTVKGAEEITLDYAEQFRYELQRTYTAAEGLYQTALKGGVPKELARVHLPVGRYSRMRASANLRNWLAFLTLRMDPAAQWEIRCYAEALHGILAPLFPRTLTLFDEGRTVKP